MRLIVGLGNPGKKYDGTRHNIGREIVRQTAEFHQASEFRLEKKYKALVTEAELNEKKVIFMLPETYMNNSGEAVRAISEYFKIQPEDILIVQDEMDFEPFQFAFAEGGGAAGHNGIKSIYKHVDEHVSRFRIGIGRSHKGIQSEDFVLTKFGPVDSIRLSFLKGKMIDAISDWATEGLTKAMNMWNGV